MPCPYAYGSLAPSPPGWSSILCRSWGPRDLGDDRLSPDEAVLVEPFGSADRQGDGKRNARPLARDGGDADDAAHELGAFAQVDHPQRPARLVVRLDRPQIEAETVVLDLHSEKLAFAREADPDVRRL